LAIIVIFTNWGKQGVTYDMWAWLATEGNEINLMLRSHCYQVQAPEVVIDAM
jgi:hypothetical protein